VELEKLEYDYKVLKSENSDLRTKLKAAHLELNKLKQGARKFLAQSVPQLTYAYLYTFLETQELVLLSYLPVWA